MKNTEKYKEKLIEEKNLLELELKSIGHVNPKNKDDWQADPPKSEIRETADKNISADRFEDFEERAVINAALEERLQNVNDALKRIEEGTYGICSVGNHKIEEARLDANPASLTCKEHME